MDATALLSRAIFLLIVRGEPGPVWKAPRYFILARAARLSPYSVPNMRMTRRTRGRAHVAGADPRYKRHSSLKQTASHVDKRCPASLLGCRPAPLAGHLSRVRITLCPPRLPPAKVPAPLQKGRPNRRLFPAPFSIACASSATICFALRPINLMQNSAQPVTKVDPRKHFPVPRIVHSEGSVPCLKDSQRGTSQ